MCALYLDNKLEQKQWSRIFRIPFQRFYTSHIQNATKLRQTYEEMNNKHEENF